MGKQHEEVNTSSYSSKTDAHETSSSQVPSQTQGRDVPSEAQHQGDVAANAHDKKKAQNALHEGLQPAENTRIFTNASGPQKIE
ncbi:hypothetical protein I317_06907 [Kwoniella heveanensis CBS 569]|uniref:Uncharacterized protein n=1 Tax=Kwoniella heveanensis BCC8398 TaxID=1296120 RepID=A0A1B9GQ30_9TREE|nr:hypothetical protein I316_05272 [Kwoniella heveanensis BCC8398]OCF39282.1 hypothetical protein I317_06907 [Kwoniella heveanensis CBS 569]